AGSTSLVARYTTFDRAWSLTAALRIHSLADQKQQYADAPVSSNSKEALSRYNCLPMRIHMKGTSDIAMPTPEETQAEMERLRAENERLKARTRRGVFLKVSEKGGVSLYGLGRFPITLYV